MPVTINGSTGIAGVDGSAGTPAVQGADSNTGVFFPAADTIAFAEGGAEVARFDSSGNLGIGVTPSAWVGGQAVQLGARASSFYRTDLTSTELSNNSYFNSGVGYVYQASAAATLYRQSSGAHSWFNASSGTAGNTTNYTQAMTLDSSGNLLVGKTTNDDTVVGVKFSAANNGNGFTAGSGFSWGVMVNRQADNGDAIRFRRANADVGSISVNTTNTAYNTSSDYRLKHDIVPMAGALAKVAALKPVAYKWNVDGSAGEGFIAHELAKVCPGAVTGEKDAVDADGNPVYQGIDTSFLVATLTAAIQEQQALIAALQADVAALKGQA